MAGHAIVGMSVFASLCHDMPMAEIEDAPSASLLRLPCDSDMLRPQQGFNKVITYLASLAMVYTHSSIPSLSGIPQYRVWT